MSLLKYKYSFILILISSIECCLQSSLSMQISLISVSIKTVSHVQCFEQTISYVESFDESESLPYEFET